MLRQLWGLLCRLWKAFCGNPVVQYAALVVRFVWRYGAPVVVALLFVASFPLGSLYHIADDLEAARRLHLFAKYVLVATGFGLAVWFCPYQRVLVRLMLALFFLSELSDGAKYAVCRLAKPEDTTEALAKAWNSGVTDGLCTQVFGPAQWWVQMTILSLVFIWIIWLGWGSQIIALLKRLWKLIPAR